MTTLLIPLSSMEAPLKLRSSLPSSCSCALAPSLASRAHALVLTPGDSLKAAISANPKTKADLSELSSNIIAALIKKHETNPLFPAFVEQLAKDLCESLSAVQTRKVSSALSVLGNTKQQEERDKASGKKKVGHDRRGAERRGREQ